MRASITSRISEGRRRSGAESMVQRFSEQVASLAEAIWDCLLQSQSDFPEHQSNHRLNVVIHRPLA